ncbi:hypothetical protein GON09_005254 [Rhodococcus sp. B50]|nr:hypothetical protein [Rhodococcus sp. B50]
MFVATVIKQCPFHGEVEDLRRWAELAGWAEVGAPRSLGGSLLRMEHDER